MGFLYGRGRNARGTYPEGQISAGGVTAAALRNRNIALATNLVAPFTPAASLIAAIAFTPKVSGVLQVSANIGLNNGVDTERYSLAMITSAGTGITVTGGASTSDGWMMGSTVPPVIGGVIGGIQFSVQDITASLGNGDGSVLSVFGISPAPSLPLGVPAVVRVFIAQLGGGHALSSLSILNLSVLELP